ncbi:MAG: PHP-associated domain-containing protein [Faecousia sp.]
MAYRYETHMHTSEASACARSTGAEMARAHLEAGYTGIFVTDHFFNGNTAVPQQLPWRERVARFCRGYENAWEEGQRIGLQVFFGLEYNYHGAEFLVYNLDRQWLLDHEDIDRVSPRQALALMRGDGGFVVQAHPFRERGYIDHIQLFPRDIDAVEAINAAHLGPEGAKMNRRAFAYADMFGLPVTAGSDSHHTGLLYGSGVETPGRIERPTDYLNWMRAGALKLIGEQPER